MSLNLDERQRAMLLEMGVRVWQPEPGSSVAEVALTSEPRLADEALARAAPTAGMAPAAVSVPRTPAAPAVPRAPGADAAAIVQMDWPTLQTAVSACEACALCTSRKSTVFGVGSTQARWLVVGEAPGEQEDLQGEPFMGQAGLLLDNMLKALGLSRDAQDAQAVYLTNALKCRPPANRNPQPDEVTQCAAYLQRQVALVQPTVILAMGKIAAQALLQDNVADLASTPLGKLRGQVHRHQGVPVVVTYHPAYLLRTPADKGKAWADLCLARAVAAGTRAYNA
jgi:DNA polymerase